MKVQALDTVDIIATRYFVLSDVGSFGKLENSRDFNLVKKRSQI